MNPLISLGQLLWDPEAIIAPKPFEKPSPRLQAGFLAGIAGMGTQAAWIIPPDDLISIAGNPALEFFVNKAVGFTVGILFLVFLLLVDLAILACFRLKKVTFAIQGSFAVFAFIPLVAIPIHALFPPHLGRAGDVALVWILITGFLSWHATWLGMFLRGGHVQGDINARLLPVIVAAVLAIEITGGVLFVLNIPTLFNSNLSEFFWSWF
jgi:hypothetical protein